MGTTLARVVPGSVRQSEPAGRDSLETGSAGPVMETGAFALGVQPDDVRPKRTGSARRLPRRVVVFVLAALVLGFVITVATVDSDSSADLASVLTGVVHSAVGVRWQFAAVVVPCAIAHYLATAVAARAVSTVRLPWRELFLVQLAAAAANRITPAGLGGSSITARYFARRGMTLAAATGAILALTVLGGVADLVVGVTVIGLGTLVGLGGGAAEFSRLGDRVLQVLGPLRSPWLWLVVAGLAAAAVVVVLWRRQRNWRRWLGEAAGPVSQILHHRVRLAQLFLASGTTTLVLGIAFVASVSMVPGRVPTVGVGALLIGFMLASAAGSAVPIPAGLGSTEAALVAVLVQAQVPLAHAVEQVLLFRVITFWSPAVFGLLAAKRLYRTRAL